MGILVAMAYPTSLFANQADHTYVKCSTGGKAWGCWGGKSGGKELRRATGSTKRGDCIARPDEKANIKCYLINGVCHQAANRILLPAGITVRGARGYSISEALFGTYGRVGIWPCSSPFNKCGTTTGDLSGCGIAALTATSAAVARTEAEQFDWVYINSVLKLYAKAPGIQTQLRSVRAGRAPVASSIAKAETFHVALFANMAEYKLGPLLDRNLERKLLTIRRDTERKRIQLERQRAAGEISDEEFVSKFDGITIEFQDKMASALKPAEYVTLFDAKPDERFVLSDKTIVKKEFGI
ncbi:MAG: hypothetical protein M3O61_08800 [Gemmatimonadota bacterium]|nr:hypothetical protein [Gemmatimonadota bacterium]